MIWVRAIGPFLTVLSSGKRCSAHTGRVVASRREFMVWSGVADRISACAGRDLVPTDPVSQDVCALVRRHGGSGDGRGCTTAAETRGDDRVLAASAAADHRIAQVAPWRDSRGFGFAVGGVGCVDLSAHSVYRFDLGECGDVGGGIAGDDEQVGVHPAADSSFAGVEAAGRRSQ